MTEKELHETLSFNIKKYRKGKFTQEQLAEKIGVSAQNINDIEGKRRWPREGTLVKIADALEIDVYQLFVPINLEEIVIENNDENTKIKLKIKEQIVSDFQNTINKMLNKWKNAED
ncbi:MAG: helix-turn-helix transcriptional regulator [Treponema sp.]|nr:helix-turn-helix transcriptional regulator [Candidatus Treponema merdequi]